MGGAGTRTGQLLVVISVLILPQSIKKPESDRKKMCQVTYEGFLKLISLRRTPIKIFNVFCCVSRGVNRKFCIF